MSKTLVSGSFGLVLFFLVCAVIYGFAISLGMKVPSHIKCLLLANGIIFFAWMTK